MANCCGECLMTAVEVVELVEGKCPRCGIDYNKPIGDEAMPVIVEGRPIAPAKSSTRKARKR